MHLASDRHILDYGSSAMKFFSIDHLQSVFPSLMVMVRTEDIVKTWNGMSWNEIKRMKSSTFHWLQFAHKSWDGTLAGKNLLPQRKQILFSKSTSLNKPGYSFQSTLFHSMF